MSFNTLVRAYMDKQQAQTAAETLPDRPGWLRRLAGSAAAVGLGLGFFAMGCGGTDPAEEQTGLDEGKEDSLAKSKKCYANKDCTAGQYCKKVTVGGPVITPKYGINPSPIPTPAPKYGILPPPPTGVCKPLAECDADSDCAKGQRCEGAVAGSSCPEGAYCILPPTPPQPGICTLECNTTADCAKGETCVKPESSCPEGAYCILPPTPQKGLCQLQVYAILPPNW